MTRARSVLMMSGLCLAVWMFPPSRSPRSVLRQAMLRPCLPPPALTIGTIPAMDTTPAIGTGPTIATDRIVPTGPTPGAGHGRMPATAAIAGPARGHRPGVRRGVRMASTGPRRMSCRSAAAGPTSNGPTGNGPIGTIAHRRGGCGGDRRAPPSPCSVSPRRLGLSAGTRSRAAPDRCAPDREAGRRRSKMRASLTVRRAHYLLQASIAAPDTDVAPPTPDRAPIRNHAS